MHACRTKNKILDPADLPIGALLTCMQVIYSTVHVVLKAMLIWLAFRQDIIFNLSFEAK